MHSKLETIAQEKFGRSYLALMGAVVNQMAEQPSLRGRMTTSALTLAVGIALAMTAAPQAQAEESALARTARGTIGAIIGGALGSQIGGGSGKTAATAAGAAAGIWASEAIGGHTQEQAGGGYRNQRGYGPMMPPDWNAPRRTSVQGMPAGGVARLQSGTTPLSADRANKLVAKERAFLDARDTYARTLFAAQQAQDDAVLDGYNPDIQRANAAASSASEYAQQQYAVARKDFVEAVEYLGSRGYAVHAHAYAHKLAYNNVTANDLARRDMDSAATYYQADVNRVSHRENYYGGN